MEDSAAEIGATQLQLGDLFAPKENDATPKNFDLSLGGADSASEELREAPLPTPVAARDAQFESEESTAAAAPARVLAPMLRQYRELKEKYPEHRLLFQVGDFYEVFFEDAEIVSEVLSIRLTSRDKSEVDRIPMCGVPIHAIDAYLPRLLAAGHSCVLFSQVEEDRKKTGAVRREISRIVTPGVRLEGDGLENAQHNFLVSVIYSAAAGALALVDVSTGLLRVLEVESVEDLVDSVVRVNPAELLIPNSIFSRPLDRSEKWLREVRDYASQRGIHLVQRSFEESGSQALELNLQSRLQLRDRTVYAKDLSREGRAAVSAALSYVDEISFTRAVQLSDFQKLDQGRSVFLDSATRRNLELFETRLDGGKKHSLFAQIDFTRTAMGSRLLGTWLLEPSCDLTEITRRQDAVGALVADGGTLDEFRKELLEIRDLERILSRVTALRANPRDLLALGESLRQVPPLRARLQGQSGELLATVLDQLDPLEDLTEELCRAIVADAPLRINEGGIFQEGYREDLDTLRTLHHNANAILGKLESDERAATGITNLKIRYNGVFGYFLEVNKSQLAKIPAHYERRQTLANAERYVTRELKELESKILSARARQVELEREEFVALRNRVASQAHRIQQTCRALGMLDAIASLAFTAREHQYRRPEFVEGSSLEIRSGRHPVIERTIGTHRFVPNDTALNVDDRRLAILTAPNMGGKSTYLRQIALIQVLAQIGSFVPAEVARLSLVDRIFTRIGAADDLARGDSTFMVEMREATTIIRRATKRSLVLIDEIGRGTATSDGLAIAVAIAEWLREQIGCKTVFATHFHELAALASDWSGAFCLSLGVLERDGEIEFTHRIEERPADRSYGIEVARLAGLPSQLIARAQAILAQHQALQETLPSSSFRGMGEHVTPREDLVPALQPRLFDGVAGETLIKELATIDANSLSPIEALLTLARLHERALPIIGEKKR